MSGLKVGMLVKLTSKKMDIPLYSGLHELNLDGDVYFDQEEVGLVLDVSSQSEWGRQAQVLTSSGKVGWNSLVCFEEVL